MSSKVVTQKDFDQANEMYGHALIRYLVQFTEDEGTAHKVLQDVLWEIPVLLKWDLSRQGQSYKVFHFARKLVLHYLKTKPFYHPWSEWTRRPDYFALTDTELTQRDIEIFNRHYFRGIAYPELATRFNVPIHKIVQKINDTFRAICLQQAFLADGLVSRIEKAERQIQTLNDAFLK